MPLKKKKITAPQVSMQRLHSHFRVHADKRI